MKRRALVLATMLAVLLAVPLPATAQHGADTEHMKFSKKNVQLFGRVDVSNKSRGRVSDVAGFKNYAYLGAYTTPDCKGGVYVIDVNDPRQPREVAFIPAAEDTYVSEGVHVIHLNTPAFKGDVLLHSNESCSGTPQLGGMDLVDVTDPTNPKILSQGEGDFTDGDDDDPLATPTLGPAHSTHSVFGWQQGPRAYAALVDNIEGGIDIMEITNPRAPVLIEELGADDWDEIAEPLAYGDAVFLHDMVVKQFGDKFIALLSYWDAGWILLDVTNPQNPVFIKDSDYNERDPLMPAFAPPEGNAHQAEWSRDGEFIIGTDEDFSPYRVDFAISTGPHAGPYSAGEFGWTVPIVNLPDKALNGPTVYGGYACPSTAEGETYDEDVPTPESAGVTTEPGEEAILVLQRGPLTDLSRPQDEPCFFSLKVHAAQEAGWDAAIVANHHEGSGGGPTGSASQPDAHICGSKGHEFTPTIPAICIGHRALHRIFKRSEDYTLPYPPTDAGDREPNIGDKGEEVAATARFDGWGYVHLLDAQTLQELDQYAPPGVLEEQFASGYGDLTVHEVATDPSTNLAYFSWYANGFRVARFSEKGIKESGHYIDAKGNDLWGVDVHTMTNGRRLIFGSDRDSGLFIFRYTGPGGCDYYGTPANDRFIGLKDGERFCGDAGADELRGKNGRDLIRGEEGKDVLVGGAKSDRLVGGPGRDLLRGGPGKRDVCRGGKGPDKFRGCEVERQGKKGRR